MSGKALFGASWCGGILSCYQEWGWIGATGAAVLGAVVLYAIVKSVNLWKWKTQ